MRLWQYALTLIAIVSVAISAIWQQVRIVRAGYRLQALERDRDVLSEERRELQLVREHEARWEALVERAKKLSLSIPGETKSAESRE
jgi:hypothetical protein